MIFEEPIFLLDDKHPDFERLLEQSWYLKGVLLADKEYRMDKDFSPSLIDAHGNGTKAFWRGVLETGGSIRMDAGGGRDYKHPYVELRGSYAFLSAFLAFLEEELGTRILGPVFQGGSLNAAFDDDCQLASKAAVERVWVKGPKAHRIVRLLYLGQTVGRASPRRKADEIVTWCSGKR